MVDEAMRIHNTERAPTAIKNKKPDAINGRLRPSAYVNNVSLFRDWTRVISGSAQPAWN